MKRWVLILIVLAVAAVFRLQNLASVPAGLNPQEFINAEMAAQMAEAGNFQFVYPESGGQRGLMTDIQAFLFRLFGVNIFSFRFASALAGILTVLGLYFLAKRLFNWQIGLLASYFLAISFWHVNFSRQGLADILLTLFLVWALYFFWRGLSSSKLWSFALSGVFWSAGFYAHPNFCLTPLILIIALAVYWKTIEKDFGHEKYEHARSLIIRGLAMTAVVFILVSLPLALYYFYFPQILPNHIGQYFTTIYRAPLTVLDNLGKTMTMFNFAGDSDWKHNLAGEPALFWATGALFVVGFLRSWIKTFKTRAKHGHFSSTQTLLLAWFFVGLAPAIFSSAAPDMLAALVAAPVIFIFAGEGLWWIAEKIGDWYHGRDVHEFSLRHHWLKESSVAAILAVVVFLAALTIVEYDRYSHQWAGNLNVVKAFSQNIPVK